MQDKLIITNAKTVLPDKVCNKSSLVVNNGKIEDINEMPISVEGVSKDYMVIDAEGRFVLPGIIDIHTDAMDVEICPRSSADFPISIAFRELERKMINCGITTVYHSLHIGYKSAEESSRSKYSRKEIFQEVYNNSLKNNLINNKIHLRFELTGIDAFEESMELVRNGMVSLYSIMDHTPGQGQMSNENFLRFAKKRGLSEQEAKETLKKYHARPTIDSHQLEKLINTLLELGIPVASHDDDSVEKVHKMYNLGVRICEFPINMETAKEAKSLGMHTIGGASNVLRGGSTGGNLQVEDAIREGLIDGLCSDYYPPAILYSIFKMVRENILNLPEAVKLATLNPAISVNLDKNKGSIEKGKDADLVIVETNNNLPYITNVIVGGEAATQHKSLIDDSHKADSTEKYNMNKKSIGMN